jgi:cytochrome c peroxidase
MQRIHLQAALCAALGCTVNVVTAGGTQEADPAEIVIGERLFLETRFAQAYAENPNKADPVLEYTLTMDQPLRGPFAGKTMNCRSCHMVDEHKDDVVNGMRTYADFTHNSPIPDRADGQHFTPRNSMALVNIAVAHEPDSVFHFDGEFNSMEDLVLATLTGRNYGWVPQEHAQAIKHIAKVIREDDGKGELAKEFGGRYQTVLTGTDKHIPAEFRLPAAYRVDVVSADDVQIVAAVSRLIAAYVNSLAFAQDDKGNYTGSPYDQFLAMNRLPRQPRKGESAQQYGQRLLATVNRLVSPKYIRGKKYRFKSHQQAFAFAEDELAGMKLFFTRGTEKRRGGNCAACHTAPHFSDFRFHNTGLSQVNYDKQHGDGEFAKLSIPVLTERNQNHNEFLPATSAHPAALGRFRSHVNADNPGLTDLGLWNVFANPDFPAPQQKLTTMLCEQRGNAKCDAASLLPLSVAAFKTPVLRDLGHSNPYMHTGEFNTLEEAVRFYVTTSEVVKQNRVRNADRELHAIHLQTSDIAPLVAFLKALNEDYE